MDLDKTKIRFRDFEMDQSAVAPVIYGTMPHRTTNWGVVLPSTVQQELAYFLGEFNDEVRRRWYRFDHHNPPSYRIDAYFDGARLIILEINADFVDGWGTALNLARACDTPVQCYYRDDLRYLPDRFMALDPVYQPELKLFVEELRRMGFSVGIIERDELEIAHRRVYVYGRQAQARSLSCELYPTLAARVLDSKLHLALFSQEGRWDGTRVVTPRHYVGGLDPWEAIPDDAVLKFCDKDSEECRDTRWSVSFGKPTGKARALRRWYQANKIIAQEFAQPMVTDDGLNCQLVILAIGSKPIVGYVQYSRGRIINDNSVHGPLLMQKPLPPWARSPEVYPETFGQEQSRYDRSYPH